MARLTNKDTDSRSIWHKIFARGSKKYHEAQKIEEEESSESESEEEKKEEDEDEYYDPYDEFKCDYDYDEFEDEDHTPISAPQKSRRKRIIISNVFKVEI